MVGILADDARNPISVVRASLDRVVDTEDAPKRSCARIGLVVDRSGSMGGEPLATAGVAAAGASAASTDVLEFKRVTMPALAIDTVCCSMAS